MTIHKEGRTLLFVLLPALVIINLIIHFYFGVGVVLYIIIALSAVFYLLILQFFRSPHIQSPISDKHVLAPADGKVVVIEETIENEYFKDKRIQVSIFMSPINVHVNRMPVKGFIEFFKYHPGKYLVAWHPKSSTENERTTVVAKTDNGVQVLFRQIAGALARRIKWYIDEGDKLEQGQEFGFIKFGSRVDVFLPLGTDIKARIGDKTTGGVTVIAELT
ncbi:phosphatidylserine decarboxylase family protein [Fulvivirga sp. M361]|uniref:phosphatidylserine decarboxylase family protein n=1 Tax=Fulvivirga sp. M361 TaxID=2594266 RepID=UPI00117B4A49|nr:phosphatidylserine decarboxylase family protein [Fulvivirga sp. M361]TRX50949.1 phosphatidylserine decarboxylase family protein [Fulvivirga sp. M361]